jgi:hemoglobin
MASTALRLEAGLLDGRRNWMSEEEAALEAAIAICVRGFYGAARRDPMLGPVFEAAVDDWETHFRVIGDFWSSVLLKTTRYTSHPYGVHVALPIEPGHIDRWLELFAASVHKTLPAPYADIVLARARLIGDSLRAGLFPFVDKQGRPSKQPA